MKMTTQSQNSSIQARLVTLTLIVVALALAATPAASAQAYMFNRADYATAPGPVALAVGDFNGDGFMDVVTANPGQNPYTVSVLLGQANGTLAPASTRDYVVPGGPSAVAVGDFNGDGKLDIVVVYGVFNAQVAVFLGNGDGTFQTTPIVSPAGPLGVSIAVGDFDGDGKLDIAIADNETPNMGVDVMIGDGTGKFGLPQQNHTAADPRMVVVADFNGDHILDLAAVSAGATGDVSVLLGDGHGGFTAAANSPYTLGQGGCISIAAGDLRHIGKIDIIAGCQTSGVVEVLLSLGGGKFSPPSKAETFTVLSGVDDIVAGDFNGDGKLDVAVTNGGILGTVSVLPGLGTGKFKPAVAFGTGSFHTAIAAADFNRDGVLDVVTAGNPSISGLPTGSISVLLSNGKTMFDARTTYAIATSSTSSSANSIAAGNIDGDNEPDLVVSESFAGQIAVLINKGNGTFNTFVPYSDPYGPMSVVTGDFNNLHRVDVAVLNANTDSSGRYTVSVFSNTGTGGVLSPHVEYQVAGGAGGSTFTGANAIAVGDFNKDGHLDIVTVGADNKGNFWVSVLFGTGTGFQSYKSFPTAGKTAPTGVVVADFDNDGWPDLAVGNSADNTVSIFLNNHDGTFTLQPQSPVAVGGNPVTLAAGSFRGNGTIDLAIGLGGALPGLAILKGNGNGTFQSFVTYNTLNNGYAVTVGDFNHDGFLDVALSMVNPGAPGFVTILPGDGLGNFSSEVNLITEPLVPVNGGMHPIGIVAADFNNDGSLDLATANGSTFGNSGSATVLLNEPVIGLSTPSLAFGSQKVGTTSAPQTITISNPGAAPLKIISITIAGDFAETTTCPAKLAVGANCTVSVTFSPTATGARTGTLSIKDGALTSVQKIALTGTGT